jgi:uncharacterized protein YdeI (YjbR/CyaY-like superfamily)
MENGLACAEDLLFLCSKGPHEKIHKPGHMATTDKRIDSYIVRAAGFAIPILEHIRAIVREACPDVQETIKWSFPHFQYKDAILCSMAAFKEHCAFGFWLGSRMKDPEGILATENRTAMGHLGKIRSVKDLPSKKILIKYIREAMSLIDQGVRLEKKVTDPKASKDLVVPADLQAALKKNKVASSVFGGFSYSNKKEYVEWITEAKTEETRNKRLATALTWIEEGKARNWKYQK